MKTKEAKTKETGIKPAKIKPVKMKKRRLRYIAVLPSFITLMNGACGFIAIVFASRSAEVRWNLFFMRNFNMTSFALAGYMIFLAMIADLLDGRVARLTRTTSSFGGQLDSLSDDISFGVAPAFLMMKVVEYHIDHLGLEHFRFSLLIWRGIFFSAIFYAMCAVVRLARFNAENEEDESAHMTFVGLPSPAAAGIIVSLVIIHQQILPRIITRVPDNIQTFDIITISTLPLITLLSGILMVSRIRYPHLANQLLRGKKTLATLLLLFACGLLIIWNLQLAMVIGFCGFALFGVFRWLMLSIFRKFRRPLTDTANP
jgi:CDP-diacylglycerol--serine O-phosphatidyltransferase